MKIEFENVSYSYNNKDNALENISFTLEKNEIVFILGHTGSGKSTLIQHINGLLYPSKGEVRITIEGVKYVVNNREKKLKELRKNVGMVFQFPENQLFESSVLKDVMFAPRNFGYRDDEAEYMSKKSLDLLGIGEEYYQKSPFDLSGGEKRKVAIAGVISSNPKILVLDEPTSSLDNNSIKEFFMFLRQLKDEGNMIIIVSHDVNLAYEYGDKIIILDNGRMTYFGDYNNAFLDKGLLDSARIEMPFVLKAKQRLKIDSEVRNIKQLILAIKEVNLHE